MAFKILGVDHIGKLEETGKQQAEHISYVIHSFHILILRI